MNKLARSQSARNRVSGMTIVRAVPIVRQEDMTCFFIGMEFLVDTPKLGHGMRLAFPYARLLEMDEHAFRDALQRVPETAPPAPEIPIPLKKRPSKQLQPD